MNSFSVNTLSRGNGTRKSAKDLAVIVKPFVSRKLVKTITIFKFD